MIRRVYKLDNEKFQKFKASTSEIIRFRDMGVHPSLELKNSCTRPDLEVGVDWKFSAYRFSNAKNSFDSTMNMIIYLYEKGCALEQVTIAMKNIFAALQELGVVKIKPSPVLS